MPTLSEEEFKTLAGQMKKQHVQIIPKDDDARVKQVQSLIENMRWLWLRDGIDDICDLLYINVVQNSAVLELLGDTDEKQQRITPGICSVNKLISKMNARNEKTEQRIRKLQAELDALINGES